MPDSNLYGLVYRSHQARLLSEPELVQLIERSRSQNQQLGISGLLLQCEGQFLQILEGNKDDVIDLYQSIARDPRHQSVTLLAQGPLTNRAMPDWPLAFRRTSADELSALPGFADFLDGWDDMPDLARPEDWSSRLLELLKSSANTPRP